jgi:filamentous hemagglutinin
VRLPNADHALVEDSKLVDYLLNTRHPYGRAKARFFASLGYWAADPGALGRALAELAQVLEVEETRSLYGVKYVGTAELKGANGRVAQLTMVWIVEPTDPRPRLVTAYPA